MIVKVDSQYLVENECIIDNVRQIVTLLENLHYIDVAEADFQQLDAMMQKYAGKMGYELFEGSRELLSCTGRIRDCVTTVNLSELTSDDIVTLLLKPSELLLENSANEWPVLERIIKKYQKEQTYGGVIKYVCRRTGQHHLVPANAGGINNIPAIIELKNNGEYRGKYSQKVCVVFDRDTDDDQNYSSNNNRLFELFAGEGKNSTNMFDDDIYKLDFAGGYIWHMWYKRAIENYFPATKYEELGMDITNLPAEQYAYDYYHFKEPEKIVNGCFRKTMVKDLGKGMSVQDYKNTTKSFDVDDGKYDEMLLLMLKIAKIV